MGGWDRKFKNHHMQEGFSAFGVKLFFIDFLRLVIFEKNIKVGRNCWSSLILISQPNHKKKNLSAVTRLQPGHITHNKVLVEFNVIPGLTTRATAV